MMKIVLHIEPQIKIYTSAIYSFNGIAHFCFEQGQRRPFIVKKKADVEYARKTKRTG